MVPGDMSEWSLGILAKKTKFHDAGGPGTVVLPRTLLDLQDTFNYKLQFFNTRTLTD